MYLRKLLLVGLIFILTACGNDNAESETKQYNTQPINYDTPLEQDGSLDRQEESIGEKGGYPQSEQRGVNASDYEGDYTDPFTNDETIFITEELRKDKDIIQAQVASTDDRIIVAVMLREYYNEADTEEIKEKIRRIVPDIDKEIIVYTDDIHWNRMKDYDARNESHEIGDNIEEIFE
ncbi:YhcN/YlaJ family sporulation lipoprotein [Oceanobacillus bengalensis]|uniref:Sporulation protein n=1 Tax=Oceanobacillus bengalensis TaxID=1435466 RepID=A0A494Z5T2_9BACI|nr:YhcN/YlaJ family sporulation lipoprotein [Oceanobacillus bengalensis]RKQ17927.1 hypothetical protein D8M05_03300 [Oceanobacillus bengalensis]